MSSTVVDLVLDPQIRDFVLIPIVIIMFLISLFRHYVSILINTERKPDLNNIMEGQLLLRVRRLRENGCRLSPEAFHKRKAFFNNESNGLLTKRSVPPSTDGNPLNAMMNPMFMGMTDPSNLNAMMKRNATMVISNLLLYTWIDSFFSGFISVKLPFPLTNGFKEMLQRGIDLYLLDAHYVSSLSWYILTLFGLGGVSTLVLRDSNAVSDTKIMQQQISEAAGMGMQLEPWNLFKAEKDHLELVKHSWLAETAHKRVLRFIENSSLSSLSNKNLKAKSKEFSSPNSSKSSLPRTSKSKKLKHQ
jgi:hypothetical protein